MLFIIQSLPWAMTHPLEALVTTVATAVFLRWLYLHENRSLPPTERYADDVGARVGVST